MRKQSILGVVIMFTVLTGIGFASTQEAFAGPIVHEVTVTKSVDKSVVLAGTQVVYSYNIENTGNVRIFSCSTLVDSQLGQISGSVSGELQPGDFVDLKSSSVAINSDTSNTATVTCLAGDESTIMDISNQVDVDVVTPSATIEKTVNKDGGNTGVDNLEVIAGTGVTYVYKITNTGDIALNNCSVDDDVLGNNRVSGQALAISQMKTFTDGPHTINSDTPNEATLNCDVPTTMGDSFGPVSDTANVDVIDPMLTISKAVYKTDSQTANDAVTSLDVVSGTDVTYVYTYENTGDVDVENCQIVDDQLGTVTGVFNLAQGSGSATEEEGPIDITQSVTNDATIDCDDEAMQDLAVTSNSVTVTVVDPMLTIVKDVNGGPGPLQVAPNTQVTYNFVVTNTGDVPLTGCVINDPMLGGALTGTFNLPDNTPFNHPEPFLVTQDITNTATVACNDVAMTMVGATSNTVIVTVDLPSCVDLVKTADPNNIVSQGETVTYTYDITNCGQQILSRCNVVDDNGTVSNPNDDIDIDLDANGVNPTNGEFSLNPNDSETFTNDVFIDKNTKNTATVICIDEGETPVDDMAMATVRVITVGGEFLPINSVALVLAGIQSSAVWMLPTIAGLAAAGFYLVKFRTKQD